MYYLKYYDVMSRVGTVANMRVGKSISYHDLVEAMGKDSDNTAFQIIGNIIGFNSIDNVIKDNSMSDTSFEASMTTPYDIGLLFFNLVNKNLISTNSKNEFLSFLKNTDYETLIPTGIPQSVTVAHKFGADDGELNDAGIIYANKPFILVILAKDIDDEAKFEIPKLTKII